MSLYNAKSTSEGYRVTKFDPDLNVESSYIVSMTECTCPQGAKPTCRHRKMLPRFLATGRVNTDWFLNFNTEEWSRLEAGLVPPPADEPPEPVEPRTPAPAPIPPAPFPKFLRRI